MLIQPYFIFDGQDRPWFPGGYERSYGTGPSLLVQRFQELLNAFGFSWHTVGVSYIRIQMLTGAWYRLQERPRQNSPTFIHMVLLMLW